MWEDIYVGHSIILLLTLAFATLPTLLILNWFHSIASPKAARASNVSVTVTVADILKQKTYQIST
jgi:hypothetical protein